MLYIAAAGPICRIAIYWLMFYRGGSEVDQPQRTSRARWQSCPDLF